METKSISREQELLIEMVMRQTDLKFDEAKEKLENNNNNYMIVIKEALGIKKSEKIENKTVNQQIYTEIRGLMDTASEKYRRTQEIAKARQDYMERRERLIIQLKQEKERRDKATEGKEQLDSVTEIDEHITESSPTEQTNQIQ